MPRSPYEALVEAAPIGMLLVQSNGAVTVVNATAVDLLGLPRRVVARSRLGELLPDLPDGFLDGGADVARISLDEREILVESRPHDGGTDGERLLSIRDVSDQASLQRVKAAFVSDLLHKIRTPLTTIKSGLSALASSRVDPTQVDAETLIGLSRSETDRLVRVLDDIRDLFLIDTGLLSREIEMVDLDIENTLAQILGTFEAEAEEGGLTLEQRSEGKPSQARADPRLLRRALTKVLENAVRYTPSGGHVRLRAMDVDGHVEISLLDDGPGMTEEEEQKAFDRFFRGSAAVSNVSEGIGLGLTLARDLVRLMGGDVSLETGPDRGTRVAILLPRAGEADA